MKKSISFSEKLSNKFSKMTTKQKIVLVLICLALLTFGTYMLSRENDEIDYKTANKDTFISKSIVSYDRHIYAILDDIIRKYIDSYQTVEKLDTTNLVEYVYIGYTTEEYYKALTPSYKKYLGKKGYMNLAKNMMEKFVTKNENGIVIHCDIPIKEIYQIKNTDMYFCELNTLNDGINSYIGIKISNSSNTYSIFYLE